MAANLQQLIETLVRRPGTFGATCPKDWEYGNGAATFMKTCGKLRLIFTSQFIHVTDTEGSDEVLAQGNPACWWGDASVSTVIEAYGHKEWWQNAQKELLSQRLEARQAPEVKKLLALL